MKAGYLVTLVSAGAVLTVWSLPAVAGGDVDLRNTDNFRKQNGELPALTSDTGTLGNGAWRADPNIHDGDPDNGGTSKQHLIYLQGGAPGPLEGGHKSYPQYGKDPRLLFEDPNNFNEFTDDLDDDVKIDDIVSFSFDTNTKAGEPDWFVDIFTKPDRGADDSPDAWYQTNLDFTVGNLDSQSVSNGFMRHTFDNSEDVFVNRDLSDRDKGAEGSGPFNFSDMKSVFGDESILFVALGTGTNYDQFSGSVDNFRFQYQSGPETTVTRQVDFEPIPIPNTFGLICMGLISIGVIARGRPRF